MSDSVSDISWLSFSRWKSRNALCILWGTDYSHAGALYSGETWTCTFVFHWEVTVYAEHLTKNFLTCRPFFFTSSEHKTWHLHSAFLLLGRKPSSCSCCITAVTPWKFTHYRCNLLTIRLNRMNISSVWRQRLGFLLQLFFFFIIIKIKVSSSLFCSWVFLSSCSRGYTEVISLFTVSLHSRISSPLPQWSSHHQFLLKGKSHSHCCARSLFG